MDGAARGHRCNRHRAGLVSAPRCACIRHRRRHPSHCRRGAAARCDPSLKDLGRAGPRGSPHKGLRQRASPGATLALASLLVCCHPCSLLLDQSADYGRARLAAKQRYASTHCLSCVENVRLTRRAPATSTTTLTWCVCGLPCMCCACALVRAACALLYASIVLCRPPRASARLSSGAGRPAAATAPRHAGVDDGLTRTGLRKPGGRGEGRAGLVVGRRRI